MRVSLALSAIAVLALLAMCRANSVAGHDKMSPEQLEQELKKIHEEVKMKHAISANHYAAKIKRFKVE
jgi:hypothetical protein